MTEQPQDDIAFEALDRLDHLLSSKNLVGAPIKVEGATVVPLMAVGFGFGGGSGPHAEGASGAGVGGGGVPVALVVVDKDGVRIERLGRPPMRAILRSFKRRDARRAA